MSDQQKPSAVSVIKKIVTNKIMIQRLEMSMTKSEMQSFQTNIIQAVAGNEMLQECDGVSVVQAALVATTLKLDINPNLGFAYIIPYWNKKQGKKVAQFQMGYKGFVQLCLRNPNTKRIEVSDVKEGELKDRNRLTGELIFEWVQDDEVRTKLKTTGYVAYYETVGGFQKTLYMSVAQVEKHANQYSDTRKKGYGIWYDDFDAMASKTVLKALITKWASLSSQDGLSEAIKYDQSVIDENGNPVYIDNQSPININVEDIETEVRQEQLDKVKKKTSMPKVNKSIKQEDKEI